MQPADLIYQSAFRLLDDADRLRTFELDSGESDSVGESAPKTRFLNLRMGTLSPRGGICGAQAQPMARKRVFRQTPALNVEEAKPVVHVWRVK